MFSPLHVLIPLLISLVAVSLIHPRIVAIALMKDLVDCPNARKLQKTPVPILGGIAVFFGIFLGTTFTYTFYDCSSLYVVFSAILLMHYTGFIDDMIDLRPCVRFGIQLFAVGLLIFLGGYQLDNFHGFLGVYDLPNYISVPLTLFAAVGIINAMNLIDGVDGLSSAYCIMAAGCFGTIFFIGGGQTETLAILAMATIGSLIPFFLHNVFGRRSKMFIGDSGTLVLGVIMSVFVIATVQSPNLDSLFSDHGFSPVAFTLAVLSIPVFDALRVMLSRMSKGHSPFHPDKTHLHHLIINMGCSHVMTTIYILLLNTIVLSTWFLLAFNGASVNTQVFVVIALSFLLTSVFYAVMKQIQIQYPALFAQIVSFNEKKRPLRRGIFLTLQKVLDKL